MQESSVYQYLERTLRAELEVEARDAAQAEAQAQIEAAQAEARDAAQAAAQAEARAAAQAEARAAAEREYAVKNIVNILEIRFQTPVVQIVKPTLEKIDTIEQLNQLDREAMQAETLDAFIETLIRNGNA